jgi:hypothetical protein
MSGKIQPRSGTHLDGAARQVASDEVIRLAADEAIDVWGILMGLDGIRSAYSFCCKSCFASAFRIPTQTLSFLFRRSKMGDL